MKLRWSRSYREIRFNTGCNTSFPGNSTSEEPTYHAGLIPESGRSPGERNDNPWRRGNDNPAFSPGKSHEQRSLVGYGPRGCNESDTDERLSTQHRASKLSRRLLHVSDFYSVTTDQRTFNFFESSCFKQSVQLTPVLSIPLKSLKQ